MGNLPDRETQKIPEDGNGKPLMYFSTPLTEEYDLGSKIHMDFNWF